MAPEFDRLKKQCVPPGTGTAAGMPMEAMFEQAHGNAAVAEALSCQPSVIDGKVGRVFNRILGEAEGSTETADQTFTIDDLKDYLRNQLEFADGEFFRRKKIKGAAESIMEELDHDGDGQVGWVEFQTLRARLRQGLTDSLSEEPDQSEVEAGASGLFDELNEDGEVDYKSLKSATKQRLSNDTDHKNLVAQLSALLVLDFVDVDQSELSPRDRTLSSGEWMDAAKELNRSG